MALLVASLFLLSDLPNVRVCPHIQSMMAMFTVVINNAEIYFVLTTTAFEWTRESIDQFTKLFKISFLFIVHHLLVYDALILYSVLYYNKY